VMTKYRRYVAAVTYSQPGRSEDATLVKPD
jgi:hypothetical protein